MLSRGDPKKSQIDAWTNPGNSDIATLSIGGNDVGFYPVLTACILRVGQSFAGDCATEVSKANDIIAGHDLFLNVTSALQQIIEKANQDKFKVYLTGYPAFFNTLTTSCDYTTFYYWQPCHHGFHRPGNWAYLKQDLRDKINNLVVHINTILSQVADTVNTKYPSKRVYFIDPNPAFDGHRFCESDGGHEVLEPDWNRQDTWLFLSGMSDNSLPGTASAKESANQESKALTTGNSTWLSQDTCNATQNGDNDWYDKMLCEMAMAVKQPLSNSTDPNNATAVYESDLAAIARGDFDEVEVPGYIATLARTAKTFHPKTLGHQAYKNLIMAVW